MGVPPFSWVHDEGEELERLEAVGGGLEDDRRVGGWGGGGGFDNLTAARATGWGYKNAGEGDYGE